MKKKIAAVFLLVLLFAFLCSVPASATVYDYLTIEEEYAKPDCVKIFNTDISTIEYKLFNNGSYDSSYSSLKSHSDSDVTMEFTSDQCSEVRFWLTPNYEIGYKTDGSIAYTTSSFTSLYVDRKYKLTVDLTIDGCDSPYVSIFGFNGSSKNGKIDCDTTTYNNSNHCTASAIFTVGDIAGSSSSIVDGRSLEYYLVFNVGGWSTEESTEIDLHLNYISIEIYDPYDEDYGYSETDLSAFEESFNNMHDACVDFIDPFVNFSDDWSDDVDSLISKLDGFKVNILDPVYDSIPDFIEYFVSFALVLLIVRKVVGH